MIALPSGFIGAGVIVLVIAIGTIIGSHGAHGAYATLNAGKSILAIPGGLLLVFVGLRFLAVLRRADDFFLLASRD